MKSTHGFSKVVSLAGLSLTVAFVVTLASFHAAHAANTETVSATWSGGSLRLTIPYRLAHAGTGRLTAEILNPEEAVLARVERRVEIVDRKGTWREELKPSQALAMDDLVWQRVRYRFVYSGGKNAAIEGTESISQILRQPVLHIIGQQSYLAGGKAAVRVIVTDSKDASIAGQGSVRIDLTAPDKTTRPLFVGRLDARGTTEAQFLFPAGLAGNYPVHYKVETTIGSAEFSQQVRIEDKVSVLLTTEKPIYQPGQTIHVRALALDRADHEAAANRKLIFELEDSRGNKIFRTNTQTSKFGVAAAEFALADEVNQGAWHLHAILDDGARNTAETTLNVERYVLPKFKVAVEFSGDGGKARHGYRPGDHVTGTVRANYFFGKPVGDAEITLQAAGMDVTQFEAANVQGKTDDDGAYRFDLPLPAYFAGRPLSQGAARVLIEATVKDAAGHLEARGEPVTVSESPLIVTAVPEGGALAPNLENQIFILTSYADGKPAVADVKVEGQAVTTDEGGVAVVRSSARSLNIDARDKEGNHIATTIPLQVRGGTDQILLRTEHAVYRAGDRIQLKVLSTKERGAVYVDVVKEGQTVLTRDIDLVNGRAELSLVATAEMAGALDFNAYVFGQDARPVADHRLVFVQPADELKVEASVDAPVHKPGDDARIRFRVTNGKGEGVQAALGVQVVDEAVFALAEKQPGFAKVFFYLEQEAMKPRYEIHSIGIPEIVEAPARRDLAARALFAATEIVNPNRFETEAGRTVTTAKYGEYSGRYRARFVAHLQALESDLTRRYENNGRDLTRLQGDEFRDAWGTSLRFEHARWGSGYAYLVRSAGPDKRFGTTDDLVTNVIVNYGKIEGLEGSTAVRVDMEHDRGPFNGRADIVGSVVDPAGTFIANAVVTARNLATGTLVTTGTGPGGQFSTVGLPPGEYAVQIAVPGFKPASRTLKLDVRDRAVLTAMLEIGAASQTITVMNEAPLLKTENGELAFAVEGRLAGAIGGGGGGGGRDFTIVVNGAPGPPAPLPRAIAVYGNIRSVDSISEAPSAPAAHVRSYFPEALYINPEIITDQNGNASITIPLADSITTWRMAMVASTSHGALGTGASSLKVFQDFFADLDLPVTLTQGDRISIPVAVYNYSGAGGNVALELKKDDWFSLVDDVPQKSLAVESGRVGGSQFTVEAQRIGKFKLTLSAKMQNHADIIVREIEVIPNGRERNQVFNGRLETAVEQAVNFPVGSIPDAGKIFVRLYPGPLSQVIEGMDAILRMPGGCFEQTSSSTYPNVLALDYMKRTKKLTPEVHAKAEGFIADGYQRLLTFEVPGGGFSWFGQAPANKILTAYGLMEFYDMSKVHDVDAKVISRTQQWLASQQQTDGSWKPDANFINEGATTRYNSDVLRITAYIAWALENTGYPGPAVERARQYVGKNMSAKTDAYTLAVLANFAADYAKDRDFTRQAIEQLLDARTEKDDQSWWTAEQTGVYGSGASASVETTGLALQALLKWGGDADTSRKAVNYVSAKKDASGAWGSTQATIMALRALLVASEKGAADARGNVVISLNGKLAGKLTLTPDNNDLLHQFALPGVDSTGANTVGIRFDGTGGLAYQVVGRYFVPWTEKPAGEPLSIDVSWDRTHLAQDDIATATATVRNHLGKSANMVMIDLGIPPGFDLLSEDLQEYREKSAGKTSGRMEKFSLTATQAILYFDAIGAGDAVTLKYRLRAKYPIRAQTFQSRVYEYYDPDVNSVARPVQLEVNKR